VRYRFRLADLGAAYADGAGLDLKPRNVRGLVRLCVRPERHEVRLRERRHAGDISLQHIKLDHQNGRIEAGAAALAADQMGVQVLVIHGDDVRGECAEVNAFWRPHPVLARAMHDVIVVGAGSSGCAIAARASENPNRTVLLVEAGPDYSDISKTPFDLYNGHTNSLSAHDWKFAHFPTRQRELRFPRGRVVGGSSAVNTAIALHGMPEDFEEWAA